MYLHLIVLFLLSWPYARGSIDFEEQDVHLQDQVAVASQDTTRTLKTAVNIHVKDPIFFEGKRILDSTTIHYENSNGFIPITPANRQRELLDEKNENITEEDIVDNSNSSTDTQNKNQDDMENDPAYSTEARVLLSLTQNITNRRSFNTEENPNEFELLKVKNDTPAVANYQEFYENYQTGSNRANNFDNNSGGSYISNYERNRKPTTSIRDRVRNIQNYMTSYATNVQHPSGNPYNRFYSYNNLKDSQMKGNYQHDKVQNNYYAQDSLGYGNQWGSGGSRENVASIPSKINYDMTETVKKPKLYSVRESSSTVKNRHRTSKPVIVVEPNEYKIDFKIGSQSTRSQASTTAPHKTGNSILDNIQDESAKHYAHEALFNRDDGHHYDRTEESKDFSEENAEYLEITERPRKVHKSRRRPYVSETSRRLPKEHREITEELFETKVPKKRPNASKSKAHRHRPKHSIWIEDDRSQFQEESSEERNYDARAKGSSNIDITNTKYQNSKSKVVNSWTHLTPNLEISHSSGIEIDQIEKPKLIVPVKVNLVPLGNFDHATALGNSQGFDISNAVLQNFVTANPVISTITPVISTPQSVISHNLPPQNTPKNLQNMQNHNYAVGTPVSTGSPVPDVIVGQSSFHNPVQAVLVPQQNVQPKYSQNLRPQYVQSTVSPVYTVTSSDPSSFQNIPVSNFQNSVTPRPTYTATANLADNVQPVGVNQVQGVQAGPHIVISQATHQPFANYAQANVPFPSNQNIQINPNGLHGQNLISNENTNAQTVQIASTTPNPNVISNINLLTAESQTKKQQTHPGANRQFLASAGLSVSNNGRTNLNGYENNGHFYLQTNVPIIKPQLHENFYQPFRDDNLTPKTKTYIQNAHLAPTQVLQHAANLNNVNFNNPNAYVPSEQNVQNFQHLNFAGQKNRDQNQQILKAANDIFENTLKQLQQLQKSQNVKTNRAPNQSYRPNDNVGSNTIPNSANVFSPTSGNFARAQLPNVGRQNVEILNPNIKPSPIDLTLVNPFESISNYPTLLTTPIPIYSSTSFAVASKPILSTTAESISLQKYVDSLTEIGTKVNSAKLDLKGSASQNHGTERPLFNPINFEPNIDLIKSQRLLNSKLALHEPSLHNLNLVPLVPGGNFFKNSFGAHTDLFTKPKLTSNLEKYAEEMFKESLKTIYNSQKWNNDRQTQQDKNITDSIELSKLKNEMRFKNSFPDIQQSKEILEAHFSENKLRAVDASKQSEQKKYSNDAKKPESQNFDVQQLFKNDFKIHSPGTTKPMHIFYDRPQNGPNRPPGDFGQSTFGVDNGNDYRNTKFPNHFLTPPRPNSFISKSPFHDKVVKKRPGPGQSPNPLRSNNFENGNSRPISRPNVQKLGNLDVAGSNNLGIHVEGPHYEPFRGRPPYERDNENFESPSKPYSDFSQKSKDFTTYPTLTTSTPELEHFRSPNEYKNSNNEIYDINHPRTHNLLGLLMKNKQLPSGNSQNYFRDRGELKQYFENEKRRLQLQFYDDTLKNFQKKLDKSESTLKAKLSNNERKNS